VPDYFVHEEENARYKFEKMWFFLSVIKKKETTYRNHHGRVRCGPLAHWFISLLEISLVFIIDINRLLGFDPKMVGKNHKPRRREISPSHNVIGTTEPLARFRNAWSNSWDQRESLVTMNRLFGGITLPDWIMPIPRQNMWIWFPLRR
jgi:hypothetical protein